MKKRFIFGFLFLLFLLGVIIPSSVSASLTSDFFEDFEDNIFPPWTATGLWHIENDANMSYSGERVAWYGDNATDTYITLDVNGTPTSNNGELISGVMDLTSFSGQLSLEFFSYAITEPGDTFDRKEVYISGDAGANWTKLAQISAENVSTGWKHFTFDISGYAYSNNVQIKFVFDTVDSAANHYLGWLIDDIKITGAEIPKSCFDLWIEQDNFAVVGNSGWMDFYVESFFNHGMWVDIEIEVYGPIPSYTLLSDTMYIPANGSWSHYDQIPFTVVGDYDIRFTLIDDIGEKWETWGWYKVLEKSGEFLYLDIEQDNFAFVGEEKWMCINAYSNFSYDLQGFSVFAEIITPLGYNETLYLESNFTIYSYSWWDVPVPYTFADSGNYEVWVYLTLPTGETWHTSCWWEVDHYPTNMDLELILDFEKEIPVNETTTFTLNVKNHFDVPVEFWVNFSIVSESGLNDSFNTFYVPSLQPGTHWMEDISGRFTELGEYTLLFEVEMYDESYYCIEEYIKVYDPNQTNESKSGENTTTIPSLTPGFEVLFFPMAILPLLYLKKKRR